jgi:hypothetical protein
MRLDVYTLWVFLGGLGIGVLLWLAGILGERIGKWLEPRMSPRIKRVLWGFGILSLAAFALGEYRERQNEATLQERVRGYLEAGDAELRKEGRRP